MTLEELDDALTHLGFDLHNDDCLRARDKILSLYGIDLLKTRDDACSSCWIVQHGGGCKTSCHYHDLPSNPVEASKKYLTTSGKYNGVDIVMFTFNYIVPVFEELSGKRNIIETVYEQVSHEHMKKKNNLISQ